VDEHEQPRDGDAEASDEPHDAAPEESDPESSAASEPPPGQDPGDGKEHDL
jgi:hypothetical protein